MNKLIVLLLCVVTLSFVVGCSGDKVMRERFGDNRPVILVDERNGDKYVVSHHMGDTYSVIPLYVGKGD